MRKLTFLIVFFSAATAFALDADDIRSLHATGLDEGTIINVIRGTTEQLDMTAEDVEALEAEGIPGGILSELRLQLGLSDAQETGSTPTLQSELAEQQRLEAERRRVEQERMDREREAMRGELAAERERAGQVDTGFQGLRRASRLRDEGDCIGAAAVYNEFLEDVAPSPMSDEYYQAKFGLVESLYTCGIRDAIRADALEVALMGADRRHFAEAISILHAVIAESGFNSPRIADLSNEVVGNYSPEFQDEFNYFMGRYYYDSGELGQALNYLGIVDSHGEFGARAAFLSGAILVSPEMGQYPEAIRWLEDSISSADYESDIDREVAENAYLALARVLYQVGEFGGALYYYQKIPVESPRWTTALFEGGWSHFLSGNFNRAVGHFHSLHSPYHQHRFYPDLYVLEAAAYLYSCNIDEAYDAVSTFEDEVGTMRSLVREFVAEATDPMAYFHAVFDPEGVRRDGGRSLPETAIQVVMADAGFHRLYRIISQLERELVILEPAAGALAQRGDLMMQLVEGDLSNRQIEAAVLIHDVIRDLVDELDDWWFRAQEVTIEIQDVERRYLETILRSGSLEMTEGTTFFVVADDWQYWPWEGEYWLDEVGNYRANLTTRCPDDVRF
jgi:tetratricopeptide (TPR) repeat protein